MSQDLRISVSKTKCFVQCKKQYQFSYILKFPKKDRDYHIFGKFCHKVLEDFYNHYLELDSNKPFNVVMGEAYKNAIQEFGSKMTPEMKKECWGLIDKYLRIITHNKKNKLSANVLACEKKFEFEVVENVILNGMIDRVQIDADNVVHVADYKTTKNKKYLKEDWFQLLTYAHVLVRENPSIQKVRGSYILLRHDFEYITKEFELPEIMSVKDKYQDYANQMLAEKEFPANTSALCAYCDFLEHCEPGKEKANQTKPSAVYGEISW